LNEEITSYENTLSASEKKNVFLFKILLELEEECEKGNNDLSSVKNCTGDDAEKLQFAIERKINSLRKEVHALKLASSVEEAERFEIELSVENENRALRKELCLLSVKLSSEECDHKNTQEKLAEAIARHDNVLKRLVILEDEISNLSGLKEKYENTLTKVRRLRKENSIIPGLEQKNQLLSKQIQAEGKKLDELMRKREDEKKNSCLEDAMLVSDMIMQKEAHATALKAIRSIEEERKKYHSYIRRRYKALRGNNSRC